MVAYQRRWADPLNKHDIKQLLLRLQSIHGMFAIFNCRPGPTLTHTQYGTVIDSSASTPKSKTER